MSAEQLTPLSLGIPSIGSTTSRFPQSDEIRYFSMRKESNIGLQQSSYMIRFLKEESYHLKPHNERKKSKKTKKLVSITQQTSNQTIVKTPQPKNNGLSLGNNKMEARKTAERKLLRNSEEEEEEAIKRPTLAISKNTAWTTVVSKSSNSAITAGSHQPNNAIINFDIRACRKDSIVAWNKDSYKGINDLSMDKITELDC
ncbi:13589_t:CDS:2 [Funneliformis geosporum]|nr:13589_t:CDS:2 [Funneliformis geosporum]